MLCSLRRGVSLSWGQAGTFHGDPFKTLCFRGNVPVSLLCTGTPGEVKAYLKSLINTFGREGGLNVDRGAILDEAKAENVKALVDFTKEYSGISSMNQ